MASAPGPLIVVRSRYDVALFVPLRAGRLSLFTIGATPRLPARDPRRSLVV
jgi:hypothetical protein